MYYIHIHYITIHKKLFHCIHIRTFSCPRFLIRIYRSDLMYKVTFYSEIETKVNV